MKRISNIPILMFLPVIFFAALASAFYIGLQRSDNTSLPSVLIGQLAPNISKEELYPGSEVTPEILQSPNIKLVNFWASWCPPCRAEHSKLLEIADSGTVIVGVNIKDDKKNAVSYLQNYNNPFRAISYDPNGRTAIDWGVTAPPETFIIDKDGKVLFRFAGPLVGQDYLNRFLPAYESALTKK